MNYEAKFVGYSFKEMNFWRFSDWGRHDVDCSSKMWKDWQEFWSWPGLLYICKAKNGSANIWCLSGDSASTLCSGDGKDEPASSVRVGFDSDCMLKAENCSCRGMAFSRGSGKDRLFASLLIAAKWYILSDLPCQSGGNSKNKMLCHS